MTNIPPPNPLSYEGQVALPYIQKTFPPNSSNINFSIATIWVDTQNQNAYILVSKAGGIAKWAIIGGAVGEIDTITTPDAVVVVPTNNNVNFLNGTGLEITGSGSDVTFNISVPINVSEGGTGSTNLTGILTGNGTSPFTASTINQHDVLVGGSSNSVNSISPSSTNGIPLISQGSASNPSFGTAVVEGGGTGLTSTTAYGVICGGTTNIGAFQNAGTGTAGQFLVSNGTSALPSWQSTLSSFTINVQVFTTNGTYTPTAGMKYCIIEVVGGGGGGGGIGNPASGISAASSGGGGGGYARLYASSLTIGASQSVTIGNGGSGGVGSNNGTSGGSTSFGSGPLVSATGGNGGLFNNGGGVRGVVGGVGSSGDFQAYGGTSSAGYSISTSGAILGLGGNGGSSIYGAGGAGPIIFANVTSNGNNGLLYGGGGSGASGHNGSGAGTGGNGVSGIVIITEYIF